MRGLAKAAVCAIALAAAPCHAAPAAPEQAYSLPGASERVIASAAGERYRVMVYRPDQPPPPGGYPVLYVLDGDDNFPIAAATARRLIRAGARSGVEPGIVVAIDSGDLARRSRDFTPVIAGEAVKAGQPGHGLPTGGADAFLEFLETRVHPQATAGLPVDARRLAVVGHSFGGLLALHALAARPQFFATYIAASPSLWIGDGQLLREARLAPDLHGQGRRLIINLGEREGGGALGEAAPANAEALRAALTEHGVDVTVRRLSGEVHATTMPPTLTDAVRAAFGKPKLRKGGPSLCGCRLTQSSAILRSGGIASADAINPHPSVNWVGAISTPGVSERPR